MSATSDATDLAAELAVPELILATARANPERTALIYPDPKQHSYSEISYGDLAERIARIASGLRQRGVSRGDRVVVLIPMSPDLYAVMLAVVAIGAVAVFVEPASTISEIARTIRLTRATAFIGIAKAHLLRLLSRDVARVPVAIVVGGRASAFAARAETLATVELAEPDDLSDLQLDHNAPALLTFSSGSTGTPKGATRSHRFLRAQHLAIEEMSACRSSDVHLSAFAMVHLSTLATGASALIPRLGAGGVNDVQGADLADLVRVRGVTVISGSPTFLAPMLETAAQSARPLPSVRCIASGGAPVPVSLCETASAVLPNGRFLVVYGSTEAEPICIIEGSEVCAETAALTRNGAGLCVGRPHHDVALRLLQPKAGSQQVGPGGIDALCVEFGEVGEVAVAGPHVNEHYYRNRPAELACKLIDERGIVWHRTGDAAYLDEHGRLWVVGRIGDIVERADQRYHPAAVEALAQTLPQVERAALVADGDSAVMVVQPLRRSLASSSQRRAFERDLRATLSAAGVELDRLRFASVLPTDSRHRAKLDYPAIRRSHTGARAAGRISFLGPVASALRPARLSSLLPSRSR